MADCTIPCGANCGATQLYNPVDVLAPIFNSGLPALEVRWPDYTLNAFLFGNYTNPDSSLGLIMRNARGNGIKFTDDNCGLSYSETYHCAIKTNATAIAGATITVSDISELRGITAGVSLHLVQSNPFAEEYVIVQSVAGNVITLTAPTTVITDVAGGVTVIRGAYTNCDGDECNGVNENKYTTTKTAVFSVPFRRLKLSADVKQCELSVQRYGTENPGQMLLNDINMANKVGYQNEMSSIFYYDNGWVIGHTGNINTTQTHGLRPGIAYAEAQTGVNLSYDMSVCCDQVDGPDCKKNAAMIDTFYSLLESAYESGLYNGKSITGVMNRQQKRALTALTRDLVDARGFVMMYDSPDSFKSIYSNLDARTIQFGSVTLDLYYDKFLDQLGVPYMAILPVDQVFFVQRPFVDVTASGSTLSAQQSVMSGIPTFKVLDRTQFLGDGTNECFKFKMFMDFGIVMRGMCSGAYREFFNFAPCNTEACDACTAGRTTVSKFLTASC